MLAETKPYLKKIKFQVVPVDLELGLGVSSHEVTIPGQATPGASRGGLWTSYFLRSKKKKGSHSRIQNSKIFFQNTFRQLENLKYWRNFEGVHEKREFRFFTEKMSSILNLSLVFSDQLVLE